MPVLIEVDGEVARCHTPYELRYLMKQCPGRRWDKDRKAWLIPLAQLGWVQVNLRTAGQDVLTVNADGTPYRPSSPKSTSATDWARALFAAVGPTRADSVYRALARVLHPDTGGDKALMQQLNAARDAQPRRTA